MVNETVLSDDSTPKRFQFVGGELCLDYCNTVGGKREGIAREKLHSYDDFVGWCEQANLVDASHSLLLKGKAAGNSEEAGSVLVRALELRESIYRIFLAIIENAQPSEADMALLNAELAESMGRMRIGANQSGEGFGWRWAKEPAELDTPLGPLAHSAASLLASDNELAHVRQCRGENCGWLFIDLSKNHSRRWCDMRDCGNRAKVRRHRQKHHSI
jgi:predicted RNA-binding Zn ribbon-like protein